VPSHTQLQTVQVQNTFCPLPSRPQSLSWDLSVTAVAVVWKVVS
jgi:hypothetical protein